MFSLPASYVCGVTVVAGCEGSPSSTPSALFCTVVVVALFICATAAAADFHVSYSARFFPLARAHVWFVFKAYARVRACFVSVDSNKARTLFLVHICITTKLNK